ncbi:MAG: hypothetical protein RIG63_26740 [Coleofasciculus chthonoplastes F3-SA18-01]|uniref:tetratricopeptide repeat protein n=1 Tax=Coleofasciculus chthonoplastes TaxID=64178 RepID=UPI0032F232D5
MKFIHRTVPLLGLTAILITPVTARAVQRRPIDAATLKNYIAQTTAEDFLQRGIQQEQSGDLKGAITNFNRAIELNHFYSQAYGKRGVVRLKQGDINGAISDSNKFIFPKGGRFI